MQFSGNFKGKILVFSKFCCQGPTLWGQNSAGPPWPKSWIRPWETSLFPIHKVVLSEIRIFVRGGPSAEIIPFMVCPLQILMWGCLDETVVLQRNCLLCVTRNATRHHLIFWQTLSLTQGAGIWYSRAVGWICSEMEGDWNDPNPKLIDIFPTAANPSVTGSFWSSFLSGTGDGEPVTSKRLLTQIKKKKKWN